MTTETLIKHGVRLEAGTPSALTREEVIELLEKQQICDPNDERLQALPDAERLKMQTSLARAFRLCRGRFGSERY